MVRLLALALLASAAAPLRAAAQDAPALPAPRPDTLARACAGEGFRQFDFWIGRWSVGPLGRPPGGVNEITRTAQGCALREQYHNAGGYTGTSLNFYDPRRRTWTQLWVDNAGLILRLEGGLDAEGRMVLSGERTDSTGAAIRDRITWIPREDGSVHQVWDRSADAGQTWENVFTGEYLRLPPAAERADSALRRRVPPDGGRR